MHTSETTTAGKQAGPGRRTRPGRLRPLLARMLEDIDVVLAKDPAARSRLEVLLYPHIHALWLYRVAHRCYEHDWGVVGRALSMFGRAISGIEIHPGARIGRRFFIDHGSGVVIGETAVIGDDVMLYHQVTLGSIGWWRDHRRPPGEARHPTIEDGVIVGAGAMVLGAIVIGARSRIGANAVVLTSLPPNSRVNAPTAKPAGSEELASPAASARPDAARPDIGEARVAAPAPDGVPARRGR